MKPHVMVDLETLGTGPDARIVQIGAVTFDDAQIADRGFNVYVTDDVHGKVDGPTVQWWLEQSQDARSRLAKGLKTGLSAFPAALAFEKWFTALGDVDAVWAWPSSFDFPILESFFRRHGMKAPYSYRKIRDARTLREAANAAALMRPPYVAPPWTTAVAHDAMDDCIMQAHEVQGHHYRLGVWSRPITAMNDAGVDVISGRDPGDEG